MSHKSFVFALLALFLPAAASADIYTNADAMGMGEVHTWISGKKKREEAVVSFPGLPAQTQITITRVDKGKVWTLDPALKAYEERPIFVEDKEGEQLPSEVNSWPKDQKWADLPEEEKNICDPKLVVLPQKREVAGFQTTGYQAVCPGDAPTTLWMAPVKGVLAKFEKEQAAYDKAYRDELYKKLTKNERKMVEDTFGAMGNAMGQMLLGIRSDKLPKGVPLRMERSGMGVGPGSSVVMINMKEINDNKADSSLFEVPKDFKKVENLMMLQSERMAEQMGMGGMMKEIEAYGKRLEAEEAGRAGGQPESQDYPGTQESQEEYVQEEQEQSEEPVQDEQGPEYTDEQGAEPTEDGVVYED